MYYSRFVEVVGFWVVAAYVTTTVFVIWAAIIVLMKVPQLCKRAANAFRDFVTHNRPSKEDILAWLTQWFQRERNFIIAFIWALTWLRNL